jgi:hypothetical protein
MFAPSKKSVMHRLPRHAHSRGNLGKRESLIAEVLYEVQPIQIRFASWTHQHGTLSREKACVADHPSCRCGR